MLDVPEAKRAKQRSLRSNKTKAARRIWRPEGFVDLDLEDICRDEKCDRVDLHATHVVVATPESEETRSWRDDPFEPERWSTMKIDKTNNKQASQFTKEVNIKEIPKPPWLRGSVKGIVHAITSSISLTQVKIASEIHQDVLNTYGSCDERSVYRHLADLVAAGMIIRVSFDHTSFTPHYSSRPVGVTNGVVLEEAPKGMLSGYLKPNSRLFKDPLALKELLWDSTCGMTNGTREFMDSL